MTLDSESFQVLWRRIISGHDLKADELKSIYEAEDEGYHLVKTVADELGTAFDNISRRTRSYKAFVFLLDVFMKSNKIPLFEIKSFMETGNSAVVSNLIWNRNLPIEFLIEESYYDRFRKNPNEKDTFLLFDDMLFERSKVLEVRKEEALSYIRSFLSEEEKTLPDSWVWKAVGLQ